MNNLVLIEKMTVHIYILSGNYSVHNARSRCCSKHCLRIYAYVVLRDMQLVDATTSELTACLLLEEGFNDDNPLDFEEKEQQDWCCIEKGDTINVSTKASTEDS